MSRRLRTVLRVAALQERVARGAAGASLAAVHQARTGEQAARDVLAGGGLSGGDRGALLASAQLLQLRAQAVSAARVAVTAAEQDRAAAVARWEDAQRRQRLFEELAARVRVEEEAAREKAAQRLADDLSAARARAGGR